MNLYRNESSDPKWNAQRNLSGRTHYVDDDTLRCFHSRIISSRHTDGGLLFAIVTSDAKDHQADEMARLRREVDKLVADGKTGKPADTPDYLRPLLETGEST